MAEMAFVTASLLSLSRNISCRYRVIKPESVPHYFNGQHKVHKILRKTGNASMDLIKI